MCASNDAFTTLRIFHSLLHNRFASFRSQFALFLPRKPQKLSHGNFEKSQIGENSCLFNVFCLLSRIEIIIDVREIIIRLVLNKRRCLCVRPLQSEFIFWVQRQNYKMPSIWFPSNIPGVMRAQVPIA